MPAENRTRTNAHQAALAVLAAIQRLARELPAVPNWPDEHQARIAAGDFVQALSAAEAAVRQGFGETSDHVRAVAEGFGLLRALVRWADPTLLAAGAGDAETIADAVARRLRRQRDCPVELADDDGDPLKWRSWPNRLRASLVAEFDSQGQGDDRPEGNGAGRRTADLIGLVAPEAGQVWLIAQDRTKTVEQRMRLIVAIDRRFGGYTAPGLAKLLGCTEQAVRKTSFWKELRAE